MTDFSDLIGIPFEFGGRDKTLDCWGCARIAHHKMTGVWVPDYKTPGSKSLACIKAIQNALGKDWHKCDMVPTAFLLIRVPGYLHVGVMINDYQFIHAWEGTGGVTIEKISNWNGRILGAYRYAAQ